MADPKGDKLFVGLPASQVRRRLKGFGHGVRKVQSAGKGRAVVIHTATGQHLDELMAVLGLQSGAGQGYHGGSPPSELGKVYAEDPDYEDVAARLGLE